MYKTINEIKGQYQALAKTFEYFGNRFDGIGKYLRDPVHKSIIFLGSGSSYAVCKSAERFFNIGGGLRAYSFAAGDMLLNFTLYKDIISGSLLVAPSRSGSTTEVVEVAKKAKGIASGLVSICAKENSALSGMADISIELPWAFDESVCQTATVTNLYTACLLLLAALTGDESLKKDIAQAIDSGPLLLERCMPVLKDFVSNNEWERVVVLTDSYLSGIGEEGALAFKEICRIHSNHYNILDVRHGPMVLIGRKTLALMDCPPFNPGLQADLVSDLKAKGAKVITTGPENRKCNSDLHISTAAVNNYAAAGIQFILVPQLVSYFTAEKKGVNPDSPEGLQPWIELQSDGEQQAGKESQSDGEQQAGKGQQAGGSVK